MIAPRKGLAEMRVSWRLVVAMLLFAGAMFALGCLFSHRQVREARNAAGEAERQKLAAEAALADAQNRFLLLELEIQQRDIGN